VLGLGDIGPEAAMPVMEGKCAIFQRFAGVDAVPLCLKTKDTDEIVRTVYLLSGNFGGINLEDISAPRCFEIERRLKGLCGIPVFHDDQHGTAAVTGAALVNALRLLKKDIRKIRLVINGAGSAGLAIAGLLLKLGVTDMILCDRAGIIYEGFPANNPAQEEMARRTNRGMIKGSLSDALRGADALIGVSVGGAVTGGMVRSMGRDPIVFALANPVPEISREDALASGAAIVGNGVSDKPNQINNALVFPGIFKGALQAEAADIDDDMLLAAVYAVADLIPRGELRADYILPSIFHPHVHEAVAAAVERAYRGARKA
jgi:malate dehydrogenase (oxaloacetate-decarboxylating)